MCTYSYNGTLMAYGQTGSGKTHTMGSMAAYSPQDGYILTSLAPTPSYRAIPSLPAHATRVSHFLGCLANLDRYRSASNDGLMSRVIDDVFDRTKADTSYNVRLFRLSSNLLEFASLHHASIAPIAPNRSTTVF